MGGKHEEPDNDNLQGEWHGSLSLGPLKEVARFVQECDDYTKELRAKYQQPVFKAHPGVKSTFVTDMAGFDYIFNAPPEELDRVDEDEPGFGGLSFNREVMLGGVTPALLSHAGNHGPAREIVVEAMRLRAKAFEPACRKVFEYGVPMLRTAARGEPVNFQHAMHNAAAGICFEWLFDIVPGPSGADAQSWIKGCFGLRADQPLADAVARRVSRAKNGPTAAQRRYGAEMMDRIRKSKPYAEHFVGAAKRVGIPEADLAAHLMFAASFNATGGAWSTLHPALAQLSVDDVHRHRLAEELSEFTGSVRELDALPRLHDFFLEAMRLFGRPRHYYRRAKVDLTLPVSVGDPVRVKAGTTLCLVATVARQDRVVWGDDASVFDPERYARDPSLRDRVCPFGPPLSAKNTYGCAGGAVASVLWKTLAAALARRVDWQLSPWPEPDVDAFDGVRPGELTWIRD